MMNNGKLLNAKLDFDMYPAISNDYPNISDYLSEKQKNGIICKWYENISDISTNEMPTHSIDQMNNECKEILKKIIKPNYTDIEKISAIYVYIIQNIKYDHESLAARNGEKNQAYEDAQNSLSGSIEKVLDKIQSSYNAFRDKKCVCEGYSNMMHYMLTAVGIKSRTVACSDNLDLSVIGKNSNHRVIRVQIEDNWYYFDPTFDAQKLIFNNFFKTKEEFKKNHVLSMTEDGILTPELKSYSNEELTNIINKVIRDRDNEEIQYQETEQENVSTQKLGKETLDMQQDTQTIDDVEKQMEEQEFEINQSGEIIRKGRTTGRFDIDGTTSEYVTQTLNEFMQNLENGNFDEESKKKKDDDFKVEKGDDDYIR